MHDTYMYACDLLQPSGSCPSTGATVAGRSRERWILSNQSVTSHYVLKWLVLYLCIFFSLPDCIEQLFTGNEDLRRWDGSHAGIQHMASTLFWGQNFHNIRYRVGTKWVSVDHVSYYWSCWFRCSWNRNDEYGACAYRYRHSVRFTLFYSLNETSDYGRNFHVYSMEWSPDSIV